MTTKKSSTFHPTLWGHFFLTYEPPTLPQKARMHERAGVLREKVMGVIKGLNDLTQIVDLIITLQRLSLDNHYEDEINKLLHVVYNSKYDSNNLNENNDYSCVLCSTAPEELTYHLFFECEFSNACWESLQIEWNHNRPFFDMIQETKRRWPGPPFMEIFISAAWEIWKQRNELIFRNKAASLATWKNEFHKTLTLQYVFLNFKDKEGKFVDADTRSLLSLYNAAYLRTHEDKLLDEAICFTRKCLEARLEHLESPLAEEVSSALDTPLFRKVRILDTINYISIYEKETKCNEAILEFAKLNFNLLQLLYCKELKEVTKWWKELNIESNLSFVRDRIVEAYFWMNVAMHEPQYSHSRIILTKMTAFITIIDDFIDSYSTTEESMRLAEAIFSWDECATCSLPECIRGFYLHLLKTFHSFEDELGTEESYRVFYLKITLKQLVQAYIEELTWRDENYIPETLSEHLGLSVRSIAASTVACSSLLGMGKKVSKKTFEWFLSYPQIIRSFDTFVRLSNDIASTEREQTGDHSVSTVQCYMKDHGTTIPEACQKLKELIEETWKDMLQYHLEVQWTDPTMIVCWALINFSRTGNYMYRDDIDKFTSSHTLKETIKSLFVEPMEV